MDLKDRRVVVTGAASGIGCALARRFHLEGAKQVVCVDLDGDGAAAVAAEIGGLARAVDVAAEDEVRDLVAGANTVAGRSAQAAQAGKRRRRRRGDGGKMPEPAQ